MPTNKMEEQIQTKDTWDFLRLVLVKKRLGRLSTAQSLNCDIFLST